MSRAEEIFELIPFRGVGEAELRNVGLTADEAIRELASLSSIGTEALRVAVLHVLLRALETYILADDKLLNVARFKDLLIGQADEHIRNRIMEMFGVVAKPELVGYLRRCLTSFAASAASSGEKASIAAFVEQRVLAEAVKRHPRSELRCSVCGYHFLQEDVGSRAEHLRDLGAVLARTHDPGRLEDWLKPTKYTQLELDHIVPEEGFGWSDADNLQLTCQFCNRGRLIFRRCLEPLSTMIAGSLGVHPPTRAHRLTRQVITVARLLDGDGTCSLCRTARTDNELTVQLRDHSVVSRLWFVPWNLETVCYRCHRGPG